MLEMLGVAANAGRGWTILAVILFLVMAALAFIQRAVTGWAFCLTPKCEYNLQYRLGSTKLFVEKPLCGGLALHKSLNVRWTC